MKKMTKGFTLIEIMIVVAILAILAAIAIPNFITYRNTAQMNACKSNMQQIVSAAEAYRIKYPTETSINVSDLTDANKGAFLKKLVTCPLGGSYTIGTDTKGNFTVTCPSASAVDGYSHTL